VVTGVNAGETAARWYPRWPEMRGDVPEGVGMREKHQDARLDAVNTQVVSALAGVHPNGGARWLLLLRAPAKRRCARRGCSCEPKAREMIRNTRANMGSGERPKGNRGEGYCGRRRRKLPAELSFSGEQFREPGGAIEREDRGETRRGFQAI
jgi:hypothetical protein